MHMLSALRSMLNAAFSCNDMHVFAYARRASRIAFKALVTLCFSLSGKTEAGAE
jgi:hypothetical protein